MSVAALASGGLACFRRSAGQWKQVGKRFGKAPDSQGFKFDDVTLMKSSFGRAEVVARYISSRYRGDPAGAWQNAEPGLGLKHYRQAGDQWEGPNDLPFFARDL